MAVNWTILGDFFSFGPSSQDAVDIDFELNGRADYRRDAESSARAEVRRDGGIGEALRLLDGCTGVSEERRPGWMASRIFPARSDAYCETVEAEPVVPAVYSTTTVHGMRGTDADDRVPERVRDVWPDPITGCVHGLHCALAVQGEYLYDACLHSLLHPRRELPNRDQIPKRGFSARNRNKQHCRYPRAHRGVARKSDDRFARTRGTRTKQAVLPSQILSRKYPRW